MKGTNTIQEIKDWNDLRTSNEELAATAFSAQSVLFDDLYSSDAIIQYKRKRVRDHVMNILPEGSRILELNAGTGEDAVFFGQRNYRVHATDISSEMLDVLQSKINLHTLQETLSAEQCSYTSLENLGNRGPYDFIFSNFAGLNCTEHLYKVLNDLPGLLKPGGLITLVILPKFCLWESLLFLKGKWKTAFRRFFSKRGTMAHVEGTYFSCWYYNPSFISDALGKSFYVLSVEGLCTIVPPSYISNFAEKYPKSFNWLVKKENQLKDKWPWKYIGDYYIITLRKKL